MIQSRRENLSKKPEKKTETINENEKKIKKTNRDNIEKKKKSGINSLYLNARTNTRKDNTPLIRLIVKTLMAILCKSFFFRPRESQSKLLCCVIEREKDDLR